MSEKRSRERVAEIDAFIKKHYQEKKELVSRSIN